MHLFNIESFLLDEFFKRIEFWKVSVKSNNNNTSCYLFCLSRRDVLNNQERDTTEKENLVEIARKIVQGISRGTGLVK